ncbi:MAG: S49 family peptidase [Dehalococcoidia bacterium]
MNEIDLSRFENSAWAMLPARVEMMLHQARTISAPLGTLREVAAADAKVRAAIRGRNNSDSGGSIARLYLSGPLERHPSLLSLLFGGTSLELFGVQFAAAVREPSVKGILIDVDSPGGDVYGLTEMAARIRAARGTKPIIAVANAEAASGAYWLASQADEVVITPSGQMGSIGVIYVHRDLTAAAAKQGVGFRIFRSSPRKADANPYEGLTPAAAKDIQAQVDAYDQMFVQDVARGRGVSAERVRSSFGAGRMMLAQEAVKAGLADRVETVAQAAARLSRGTVPSRPLGASRQNNSRALRLIQLGALGPRA